VAVAFDTLTYARRLREVGVPQEQAEAHAEALAAAVTETLATKHDLQELASASRQDIQGLASATKHDLQELASTSRHDLQELASQLRQEIRDLAATTKQDLRELELRLSIRVGGMVGVSVAAVATLVKLL
jgi:hypothetical protein